MTEHDNADEVTRLRAEVERYQDRQARLADRLHDANNAARDMRARAESAEAALTRVRECAAELERDRDVCLEWIADRSRHVDPDHPTRLSAMADMLNQHASRIRAALDPASPATRPSPAPADDEALTVCIAHGCFVPCRKDGEHRLSVNPFWVKSVRDYQGSADQSLTWEPAWERTGTGAAPSEGHSEARCHADRDGDCNWSQCPQLRDGEPVASGRHCPLDIGDGGS
jgi:hypothetical protein